MKLSILKENLNNGLSIASKIVGRNLTLLILNNILISTDKNFLNLTTTDLEIGIKYWVLAKIEKEGKITVPAKILSNFVSLLPDKKIALEVKNQILHINCENYNTKIKGLDADAFPIIPKIESRDFIELNTLAFCEGLSRVVDFSTLSQARPELLGVYLNFQKDRVQLTATDSFRLAEKTLFFEKKTDREFSFILPQKSAREIVNIFFEKQEKLRLYFSPNQILFEYPMTEVPHPQIQVVTRLIEGEYPDYQEIIPKKYEVQTILAREDFLNQIKTASIFSGKSNEVKIRINFEKKGVEILSQNPELGENESFLCGKINYGASPPKEMEAVFNYRFLVDGLLNIKSQNVIFELNGEDQPAVLKPDGDSSYIYVVMPIKAT